MSSTLCTLDIDRVQQDKDKDGYVAPAEFMVVMRSFGHKDMTEKDAAAALKEADMDGDGRVSLKDLLTFARQCCV